MMAGGHADAVEGAHAAPAAAAAAAAAAGGASASASSAPVPAHDGSVTTYDRESLLHLRAAATLSRSPLSADAHPQVVSRNVLLPMAALPLLDAEYDLKTTGKIHPDPPARKSKQHGERGGGDRGHGGGQAHPHHVGGMDPIEAGRPRNQAALAAARGQYAGGRAGGGVGGLSASQRRNLATFGPSAVGAHGDMSNGAHEGIGGSKLASLGMGGGSDGASMAASDNWSTSHFANDTSDVGSVAWSRRSRSRSPMRTGSVGGGYPQQQQQQQQGYHAQLHGKGGEPGSGGIATASDAIRVPSRPGSAAAGATGMGSSDGGSLSASLRSGAGGGARGAPPGGLPAEKFQLQEWYYRDPQGNVQGPFDPHRMQEWYSDKYFTADLPVKAVFRSTLGATADTGPFIPLVECVAIFCDGDGETPFVSAQLPSQSGGGSAGSDSGAPPGVSGPHDSRGGGGMYGHQQQQQQQQQHAQQHQEPGMYDPFNNGASGMNMMGLMGGAGVGGGLGGMPMGMNVGMGVGGYGGLGYGTTAATTAAHHHHSLAGTAAMDYAGWNPYAGAGAATTHAAAAQWNAARSMMDPNVAAMYMGGQAAPAGPAWMGFQSPHFQQQQTLHHHQQHQQHHLAQQQQAAAAALADVPHHDRAAADVLVARLEAMQMGEADGAEQQEQEAAKPAAEVEQVVQLVSEDEPVADRAHEREDAPEPESPHAEEEAIENEEEAEPVQEKKAPASPVKDAAKEKEIKAWKVIRDQTAAAEVAPENDWANPEPAPAADEWTATAEDFPEVIGEEDRDSNDSATAATSKPRSPAAAPWCANKADKPKPKLADIMQQEAKRVSAKKSSPTPPSVPSPSQVSRTTSPEPPVVMVWGTPTAAIGKGKAAAAAAAAAQTSSASSAWKGQNQSQEAKSFAQIQREEEERAALRKQRAAVAAASETSPAPASSSAANTSPTSVASSGSKRWAETASATATRPAAPAAAVPGAVFVQPRAGKASGGAAASPAGKAGDWVTVGEKKPVKPASAAAPAAAAQAVAPQPRIVAVPAAPKKPTTVSKQIPDEVSKWARNALRAVPSAAQVVPSLLTLMAEFPVDDSHAADTVDIIASMVLDLSTSVDGRGFAVEFVRRRRSEAGLSASWTNTKVVTPTTPSAASAEAPVGAFVTVGKKKRGGKRN